MLLMLHCRKICDRKTAQLNDYELTSEQPSILVFDHFVSASINKMANSASSTVQ